MLKESQSSMLIVDELSDSVDVLRTVFERRGVDVHQADGPTAGLEAIRQHNPDVVVLDLDSAPGSDESIEAFETQTRQSHAALVILGKTRRPATLPDEQVIAKPYHYGPLIRTIEQLLVR